MTTAQAYAQAQAQAHGPIPIYVSYLTFGNFLDWLKEMKVVPSQIDRSLWSTKFSGSNGAQLMSGLRFLGLLDDESPTTGLEPLAMADDATRKDLLRAVLEQAYGEDLIKDLPRMTPGLLDKKLDELGTTNPTHRKAVSFLINASKAVGLTVPAQIAKKARNKPPSSRGSSNGGASKEKPPAPSPSGKPDSSNDGSGPETTLNLPVASRSLLVLGLFQRLPIPGAVFAHTAREKWIEAAKAIFEVEYQPEESPIPNVVSTPE